MITIRLTVLNHNKSPAGDLFMESRQGFIVIGQTTMECGSSSSLLGYDIIKHNAS